MDRVTALQLRQRGTVTIPARLRERYHLSDGDPISLLDLDGVLVLVPKVSIVDKLADEIVALREEQGLSVDDLMIGLTEQRRRYHQESYDS
ncbi:MAG: AbrB/MazE/SpoVT family DNA-binding domain-containing protein [Dehalococcoidia bacterium]|nr:hypothetical protein [Chloroflexota bacterium]MBT9159905.1 hypothetical protein [Chloroflexota bacterium]MBT9162016.1 hypothetical protein [Chloroflexota bacterium]